MKKKVSPFKERHFLAKVEGARTTKKYPPKKVIFGRGEPSDSLFYIEKGTVKLGVVSQRGKEAVVAILGPGDFLGEGCLANQPFRMANATTLSECRIVRISKEDAIKALRNDPAFSESLLTYMLTRNARIQEDLMDHLFNSSEKRLARLLLLLANYGRQDKPEPMIAKISQETLAEMVGTTRSRVSFFMNRFRKLGFIEYNGGVHVNRSLLNIVLHD
jgi:CRP/FNR family cyclic AMP-dependent transcriptional regulator